MEHDNLSIIGTSHIAKQSILQIKEAFAGRLPDIVAIELDPGRLNALLQKGEAKLGISSIWRIGLKGYLFALLGSIMQKRLGRLVGIKPGSDMLTAYRLAKRHKLKIVFIDRDIRITLRRLSQSLTWKERWHFLADVFNGIFLESAS